MRDLPEFGKNARNVEKNRYFLGDRMKLFIDTEFNGFGGDLLSMGIVAADGQEFYGAIRFNGEYDPWVKQNVVPYLGVTSAYERFQSKLKDFLGQYSEITVIADWPDDLRYFCQALITRPGEMMPLPSFKCEMIREIYSSDSEKPHHALYDARAIKAVYDRIVAPSKESD